MSHTADATFGDAVIPNCPLTREHNQWLIALVLSRTISTLQLRLSLINEPVRNVNTSHPVRARRKWTPIAPVPLFSGIVAYMRAGWSRVRVPFAGRKTMGPLRRSVYFFLIRTAMEPLCPCSMRSCDSRRPPGFQCLHSGP